MSPLARKVVDGLRTTSVYEEPGGPGIVDAQRARGLIGDRAIVLVLLARTVLDDRTYRTDPRRRQRALRGNDEAVAARSRYHQLGHYVEDTVGRSARRTAPR